MKELLKKYYRLCNFEKEALKNILKEILEVEIKQKENKGKELINQEEIDKGIKEGINSGFKVIVENGIIIEEDLKELNKLTTEELKKQILETYGINNEEKVVFFPVYVGSDLTSIENYKLFCKRLDNLKFLEKNEIIKTLDLDVFYNEVEKLDKYKTITKKIDEIKQNLYDKHPKFIIDRQLEVWEKIKYNFLKITIFEKEKIENLLKLLNEIDTGEFKYDNHTLFYGGREIYKPKQCTHREIFLNLFFTQEKGKFISLKEILQELDHGAKYTEKECKKIYKMRTDLNKIIQQKTGIKSDFFTLEKMDYNAGIKRNF